MFNKPLKNIFILTSSFQLFIAEHMIRDMDEFKNSENILLFEEQYDLPYAKDCWSSVDILSNVGYSPLGIKQKKAAVNNIKLLLSLCRQNSKATRILFSNIHYSMANYIFFNPVIRERCMFSLIMDGIGSYLDQNITIINYQRDLIKYVVGQIGLGIKYRPYLGSYLGDHFELINSVYAFQSRYLACEKFKRKEVPLVKNSKSIKKSILYKKCLLLDQNTYEYVLGYKIWKKMLNIAIDYIIAEKFDGMYYKAHPGGKLSSTDLQHLRTYGFHIIKQNDCIEKLFPTLDIDVVVSFDSTSLFMLKCLYGDKVRCISLLDRISHFLPTSVASHRIKQLYRITNVEFC